MNFQIGDKIKYIGKSDKYFTHDKIYTIQDLDEGDDELIGIFCDNSEKLSIYCMHYVFARLFVKEDN